MCSSDLIWQAFSTSGHVSKCGRLKNLLPSSVSLRNLRNLRVSECHGSSCLVTSSIAKSLVQLREMIIAECKRLTEIVTDEGGDEAGDEISFSQLKYFELEYLPSLKGFNMSNHTIRVTLLGQVTVTEFSNGVVRTPKLKEVQLAEKYKKYGQRYYESIIGKLLQDGDLNTNIKRFWEENFFFFYLLNTHIYRGRGMR